MSSHIGTQRVSARPMASSRSSIVLIRNRIFPRKAIVALSHYYYSYNQRKRRGEDGEENESDEQEANVRMKRKEPPFLAHYYDKRINTVISLNPCLGIRSIHIYQPENIGGPDPERESK